MTRAQVLIAWGKPDQMKRSEGGWDGYEYWVYGSTWLYFEAGVLNRNRERGEPHKEETV
jgi:hypothetical protein